MTPFAACPGITSAQLLMPQFATALGLLRRMRRDLQRLHRPGANGALLRRWNMELDPTDLLSSAHHRTIIDVSASNPVELVPGGICCIKVMQSMRGRTPMIYTRSGSDGFPLHCWRMAGTALAGTIC